MIKALVFLLMCAMFLSSCDGNDDKNPVPASESKSMTENAAEAVYRKITAEEALQTAIVLPDEQLLARTAQTKASAGKKDQIFVFFIERPSCYFYNWFMYNYTLAKSVLFHIYFNLIKKKFNGQSVNFL